MHDEIITQKNFLAEQRSHVNNINRLLNLCFDVEWNVTATALYIFVAFLKNKWSAFLLWVWMYFSGGNEAQFFNLMHGHVNKF